MTKIQVLELCVLSGLLVGLVGLLVIEVQMLKRLRLDAIEKRETREAAERLPVDLIVEANEKGKGG